MYLQFRPTTGPSGTGSPTANPACDPNGLVFASLTYVNDPVEPQRRRNTEFGLLHRNEPVQRLCLSGQPAGGVWNDQFSRVQTVRQLTCRPASPGATGSTYPARTPAPLNVADAEYTSPHPDGFWVNHTQGYDVDPWFLGEGFGDVQVNGSFVDWDAFSAPHAYSLSTTLSGSVNLAVFDGDSNTNTKGAADWYGDNSGSLNYTITYLGL